MIVQNSTPTSENASCIGGQYVIILDVLDKNGVTLSGSKIKLGGGEKLRLPKFADPNKERQSAPLINNGQIF